jgi:hypothetical protein
VVLVLTGRAYARPVTRVEALRGACPESAGGRQDDPVGQVALGLNDMRRDDNAGRFTVVMSRITPPSG